MEPGATVSLRRGNLWGFYAWDRGLLCMPEFEDIDFGDGEAYLKVIKEGKPGYLDSSLGFHSEDDYVEGLLDDIDLI